MTHYLTPSREELAFPLQREIDKMFDTMFSPKRLSSLLNSVKSHSGYPKLDVLVTDNCYKVEAAVPGVEPSDIKVEILPSNNSGERLLKISGKMSDDYQYSSNDIDYHYRELTRAKFQRLMVLPKEITGDPEAVIRNGMLTLTWRLERPKLNAETKVISVKKI